ncbi:MAG: hypothetical protein HC904_10415 [Blastochloris sp.]|nr:hypothetical protein [Blastochloris sp.]
MTKNQCWGAFILTLLWILPLSASLVIESSEQEGSDAPKTSRMILDSKGLRVENGDEILLFRPDKDLLWILQPKTKTYHQLSETELTQMADSLKQMQSQLDQLPPEQRAQLEILLNHQLPNSSTLPRTTPPQVTYEKLASGVKLGSWTCDHYAEKENGTKVGEVWTVPFTSLPGMTEFTGMMKRVGRFFSKMPGPGMDNPFFSFDDVAANSAAAPGYPVKDQRLDPQGAVISTWELKRLSEEKIDPSLFDLPTGYELKPFMEPEPQS